MLGADIEIFEVDACVAAPGGIVVEVEGEAGGPRGVCVRQFGDDAVEALGFAEAVAEKIGFGGVDSVGVAVVGGEGADDGEVRGEVAWSGGGEAGGGRSPCE